MLAIELSVCLLFWAAYVFIGTALLLTVHRKAFLSMHWTLRIPMKFISIALWPFFIHVERQTKRSSN